MKAKSITKRVLSAVLCAVMLFSCWVFTAPTADAAGYSNVNITFHDETKAQTRIVIDATKQRDYIDMQQSTVLDMLMMTNGIQGELGLTMSIFHDAKGRRAFRYYNSTSEISVYDNNLKKKCNKKILDDLKTPQSVRDVPLHPRLKKLLLKIKAERIMEYQKVGKTLYEDDFINILIYLLKSYLPIPLSSFPNSLYMMPLMNSPRETTSTVLVSSSSSPNNLAVALLNLKPLSDNA